MHEMQHFPLFLKNVNRPKNGKKKYTQILIITLYFSANKEVQLTDDSKEDYCDRAFFLYFYWTLIFFWGIVGIFGIYYCYRYV